MRVKLNRTVQGMVRNRIKNDIIDGVISIKRLPDFDPNPLEFFLEIRTKYGIINIPTDDIKDFSVEITELG
jgi:hypothetical protein